MFAELGWDMKLAELLKLDAAEQQTKVRALSDEALLSLAAEIMGVAETKKIDLGIQKTILGNKNYLKAPVSNDDDDDVDDKEVKKQIQEKRTKLILTLISVTNKNKAALSSNAAERSVTIQGRGLADLVVELKAGNIPESRYPELLHANSFSKEDKENNLALQSRTFLAYALSNKIDFVRFIEILISQLGYTALLEYVQTPMYLGDGTDRKVILRDLFLKDLGLANEVERKSLSEDQRTELKRQIPQPANIVAVNVQNVNTHQVSTHKSADESHVTAFRMMLEANKGLGVEAEYEQPAKENDPSRKVAIRKKAKLGKYVATLNKELQAQVAALANMSDAEIYNSYLRYNDIEKFEKIEYKDLSSKDKESFDKKIKGFRFQAKTAQRFMDEMVSNHSCGKAQGSAYYYDTNSQATCGLTVEEMVATAYWASQDVAKFKTRKVKTTEGEIEVTDVTVLGNFIRLVKQLHDMRRGYDIDAGSDKPEENIYPEAAGKDNNRCHGGGVNSLSWALSDGHKAYNPKLILREDIEKELAHIYEKLASDNIEFIKQYPNVIKIWNSSGKVTGVVREKLKREFEQKHQAKFIEDYKGYIPDDAFYNVLENGLDNVKIPAALKRKSEFEEMGLEEIYAAIKNGKLPLLHLDRENGYRSTLNYLASLPGNESLLEDLVGLALTENPKEPAVQKALSFLSRSNLPEALASTEVFKIKDKPIQLKDIASLSAFEMYYLFATKAEEIIQECIEQDLPNLLALYLRKVGITQNELTEQYGMYGLDPLHYAARYGHTEAIRLLIEKGADINATGFGWTPLHYAAIYGHTQAARLLIEKGADVNAKNNEGKIPLYVAADAGKTEVVKLLLAHGASPSLSMLLYNYFSSEMNTILRKGYREKWKSAVHNAMSHGWNILEGAAIAYSGGDLSQIYEADVDEPAQKKRKTSHSSDFESSERTASRKRKARDDDDVHHR